MKSPDLVNEGRAVGIALAGDLSDSRWTSNLSRTAEPRAAATALLSGTRDTSPPLSAEQRAVCAAVGISEEAFLKGLSEGSAAAGSQLTAERRAVCAAIGVSEEAFATAAASAETGSKLPAKLREACAKVGVSEDAVFTLLQRR